VLILVALTMVAVACGGTTNAPPPSDVNTASGASHAPVTLNVWSFYTGREFKQYQDVLNSFTAKYPWITIHHTPAKKDTDVVLAINSGQAPDLAISAGPDSVAKFCSSHAYQDLAPFVKNDGMDLSKIIPQQALRYTSSQGIQCTLPVLSDAYGLYYNNDMFAAKNITTPPKTFTELEADAKALTTFNPDGSIKVAGFIPLAEFYESAQLFIGDFTGGQWYDSSGKSAFASDPTWAALLQWQKKFITDVYGPNGYSKLTAFFSQLGGPDSEWSTSHGFEVGKIAMTLDGEWRTAFIKDDKAKVNYTTAPFPVADAIASTYGRGQIGGDVIGIPRGAQHPAEAWLLVKFLATDTQAEISLAETLGNVPTTFDSLKDPVLANDPKFKPFLDIFANPNSGFKQLTNIGAGDQTLWSAFVEKWEAGKVPDLQAGLVALASQIDKQAALG
jgi:multiple sugar transport system substrate-binding protein